MLQSSEPAPEGYSGRDRLQHRARPKVPPHTAPNTPSPTDCSSRRGAVDISHRGYLLMRPREGPPHESTPPTPPNLPLPHRAGTSRESHQPPSLPPLSPPPPHPPLPPSLHLSLLSLTSGLVRDSECDRHVPGLCQIPGGRHPCHARSVVVLRSNTTTITLKQVHVVEFSSKSVVLRELGLP